MLSRSRLPGAPGERLLEETVVRVRKRRLAVGGKRTASGRKQGEDDLYGRKQGEDIFTAVRKQRLAVREQFRGRIFRCFLGGIRLWNAVAEEIAGSSERRSEGEEKKRLLLPSESDVWQ